jgi:glutaconate CoA-transferase subunit B
MVDWTPEEMMTIAAARQFRNAATCFVGVGSPSVAACLARSLHAPDMVLVYESGTIGAKPTVAPLSIADSELADTADFLVSVPEIFSYWLRGGRIKMAVLGTAQIDRLGNLNTTVVGDYRRPKVRLPGAGGAPEIASSAGEVVIVVRHTAKAFVSRVDFATTAARRMNLRAVITDMGVLEPHPETGELVLIARHPSTSLDQIRAATGWPLQISDRVMETPAPTASELKTLRYIEERTRQAHTA